MHLHLFIGHPSLSRCASIFSGWTAGGKLFTKSGPRLCEAVRKGSAEARHQQGRQGPAVDRKQSIFPCCPMGSPRRRGRLHRNLTHRLVIWYVPTFPRIVAGARRLSRTPSPLPEFVHQLRDSQAKFVVVGPDQLEKATEAVTQCGLSPDCLLVLSDTLVHQSAQKCGSHCIPEWTSIWASEEEIRHWHWKKITSLDEARSTTAIINYSSG